MVDILILMMQKHVMVVDVAGRTVEAWDRLRAKQQGRYATLPHLMTF